MMQEFEHLPDGFIALDANLHIAFINARAAQSLCCNRQEVLHCFLWDALPGLFSLSFRAECQQAIAQSRELRFEKAYEPCGVVLEILVMPHDEDIWIFLRDVTARKQSTKTLQEYTALFALSTAVSTVIQQNSNLDQMLYRVAQTMLEQLPEMEWVGIWIKDRESGLLNIAATATSLENPPEFPKRVSSGISIIGLIAQLQTPYITNDLAHDICVGIQQSAQVNQLQSFAGFPLVLHDRLVGILACAGRDRLSKTVHDTLARLTQVVAIAIDRTMARAELLSRRESLMFRLTNQIRNSLDLDTILKTAVQEIHQLLQIDRCHFLWCYYNSDLTATGAHALPTLEVTHEAKLASVSSLLGRCDPDINTILAEQVLHLRVIQLSGKDGMTQVAKNFEPVLQDWNIQSLLIVPLETRLGQLGAIVCSHCNGDRHWSQDEVELLQSVTNQLAIAMEQAELYAQTKEAALTAQTQAQQLNHALQTIQKAQAQLIHSEKMSSLGQLVAGIAHEINNPVNFISGNLVYAEEYFSDLVKLLKLYQTHYPQPAAEIQACIQNIELEFLLGDFAHLLKSMRIGSDRICQIVLSLRNFSRLDEADMKAVDIHEGLDSTLLILHNRLKPHGATFGIEVIKNYGQLPLLNCYASQLNQVFMNLLSNAIDAFEDIPPPHQITITTTICDDGSITTLDSTLDQNLTWILIHIQDNGKGISDAQISSIFNPFFTTKSVGQGTGLGLSISHQIVVEKHHGWLGCTSAPNQGTTFTVAIPVLPVPSSLVYDGENKQQGNVETTLLKDIF